MAVLAKNKIKINHPITQVYEFVVNMENFIKWFPGVFNIESHNDLRHGVVGKKYLETIKVPFKREQKIIIEVKKAETGTLFITESEYLPLLPKMVVVFSKNPDNSTNVSWAMESRNKKIIFNLLFSPLVKHILKKRAEIGVLQLKKILEGSNK